MSTGIWKDIGNQIILLEHAPMSEDSMPRLHRKEEKKELAQQEGANS
jgi:hypothetical protein